MLRKWTVGLALLAIVIAVGAAYAAQSWMPLVMATPIALIVLLNARPTRS